MTRINEVEYRDELFELAAPFTGEGKSLLKTINRYGGTIWGDDNTAVAYDYWWDTRNTKSYVFNPSDPASEPTILIDRNYQDRYSDPGEPVTTRNEYGSEVLALDGEQAFMLGDGFTAEGQFPFLSRVDLATGETTRLYTSEYTDRLEELLDYNPETQRLLAREESPIDYPNYYFRSMADGGKTQIDRLRQPVCEFTGRTQGGYYLRA